MSVGVAGKFKQKIERVRSQSEIRKYRAPSYPFETSNYRQSHILTAGIDTGGYFEIILALCQLKRSFNSRMTPAGCSDWLSCFLLH
jgi:hypothetical protein